MLVAMTPHLLPGAAPRSHAAARTGAPGVLVLHGLTSHPLVMHVVADALVAAGCAVEVPLLPGHGTVMDDLVPRRWDDWYGAAVDAHLALGERCDQRVVVGLSMGGALALRLALDRPELAGVVAINPAAQPQGDDVIGMLDELIAGGLEVLDGDGGDLADADAAEASYAGTPLRALRSLLLDGVAASADRYGDATVPLLLINSRTDHVVDPAHGDHVAQRWGGAVERVLLEHSSHVATLDVDRDLVAAETVAFVHRVTSR